MSERIYGGHTLDALLALANAATKGPWHGDPEGYCEYVWGPNNEMVFQIRGAGADLPMEANRDFAIAAREAVPALIARVKELVGDFDIPQGHEYCTDCGRAMLWQRTKREEYAGSWMCPNCVMNRVGDLERAHVAQALKAAMDAEKEATDAK